MLWTIRRKLLAVSLLAVVFVLAVGGTGLWGAQKATAAANRQQQLSATIDEQNAGAAAEYGVRGDVFEAIAQEHVADVIKTITEYDGFAAEWQSAQAGVASSKALPAKLKPAAKGLWTEAANVIALGQKAADKAKFNTDDARALAETFDTAFDKVDADMARFRCSSTQLR